MASAIGVGSFRLTNVCCKSVLYLPNSPLAILRHCRPTWYRRLLCTDLKAKPNGVPITLSESCVKRLKAITKDNNSCLRVTVEGGGCSGFQYVFNLDKEIQADDCVVQKDGVKVLVDQASLEFLKGSTIDYGEELIRSAFRIVNNPVADKGCSCGASFTIKV